MSKMTMRKKSVSIRELMNSYSDKKDDGVFGYNGNLDIRPAFQRAFKYKADKQKAVINTIRNHYHLGVMYWAKIGNGKYEVIDGQQRIISIGEFISGRGHYVGGFSIPVEGVDKDGNIRMDDRYFHNLDKDEREKILDYELFVMECDGTMQQKLDWFRTINIQGVSLKEQELRNSSCTGTWLSDAKQYFSKNTNNPAHNRGQHLLSCVAEDQDYLEKALEWIVRYHELQNTGEIHKSIGGEMIVAYMEEHRDDPNADGVKEHFQKVIEWVKENFCAKTNPETRKFLKAVNWGYLHTKYEFKLCLSPDEIEEKIKQLEDDSDVQEDKGIPEYILDGCKKESLLNIRGFSKNEKRRAWKEQKKKCGRVVVKNGKEHNAWGCDSQFEFEEMHGDHIKPWSRGGSTTADNLQMLCEDCNLAKGSK